MNELHDVLGVYFERRLGIPRRRPTLDELRAEEMVRLLWPLLDLFREKAPLLKMIGSLERHDNEADRAALALVEADNFSVWNDISLGAWAVLKERLVWTITATFLETTRGDPVMMRLPRGLDVAERRQACVIYFFLGEGRTVPEQWRGKSPLGSIEDMLASSPPLF